MEICFRTYSIVFPTVVCAMKYQGSFYSNRVEQIEAFLMSKQVCYYSRLSVVK